MKSIGTRLTVWYAVTATTTFACLFIAGYFLLENRLIHGLDLLNAAEFEQIKAHLGPDYKTLKADEIDKRIRETTDYSSVLFYITIDFPPNGILFRSTNLNNRELPDIKGQTIFNSVVQDVGELRAGEFFLPPFDILIGTPMGQIREVMRGYVTVCLVLLVVMIIISVAIGFGLSELVLRPVRLMRETANEISSDNLSKRIPVSDVQDELSGLAQLLNKMFDRLEISFGQIRRFTADASHELKTPLSLVRLHAEKMLVKGNLTPEHEDAVQVQLEELTRLHLIIDDLLFLSRADAQAVTLKFNTQSTAAFLQNFEQDALVLAEHHGLHFVCNHDGDSDVAFEKKWMRQVLLNLLTNAIKASSPGGEISLLSTVSDDTWIIKMSNEGITLSAEQRDQIFERFIRLNQPASDSSGTGLGLAICRSIVGLHHGRIYATEGTKGEGLTMNIEIPVHQT